MACKSPSVRRVTENSEAAKNAIKALTRQLKDLNDAEEADFKTKLEQFQNALNVNDFSPVTYATNIKVEFTHEFSLDLLVPVITDAIKALSTTLAAGGGPIGILTSPDALGSYTSLVNSIAEAAKSSSSAAGSATFSMNKIAPGAFAFIATRSSTLQDKETFGEESVTATSFQHGIFTSVQDALNSPILPLVVLYAKTIVKLADAKILYLDKLLKNQLTIAEYSVLSQQIDAEIEKNKQLIAAIQPHETIEMTIAKSIKQDIDELPLLIEFSADAPLITSEKRSTMLDEFINNFEQRGALYSSPLRDAKELMSYPVI
jgi:hypothetical protein